MYGGDPVGVSGAHRVPELRKDKKSPHTDESAQERVLDQILSGIVDHEPNEQADGWERFHLAATSRARIDDLRVEVIEDVQNLSSDCRDGKRHTSGDEPNQQRVLDNVLAVVLTNKPREQIFHDTFSR